ncbi:MAG: acetyl-CoA C-acyltransferase FadI [Acidobacteriota bacterium]
MISQAQRRVAIIAGCRTPFLKSGTLYKNITAIELGRAVVSELVNRTELDLREIEQVIFGTVVPSIKAPNIAREVTLGAGLPASIPAHSVSRACATATQAISDAAEKILTRQADTVIAGGAESLSDPPILVGKHLRGALLEANKAKSLSGKFKPFLKLRLKDLAPDIPAIAEPSTGLTMGQSAEQMAKENHISRQAQDQFACRSHQRATTALSTGIFASEVIHVLIPPKFQLAASYDNGIRKDASIEALAKLPPVFDRKYGTVTAGNSSPLTDGAAAVLLMSEEKAKAVGYQPLGYLRAYAYAALAPWEQLLMGPAYAAPKALEQARLTLKDIDLIEMHEAFAAQVLSNIQAFESRKFAQEKLGREEPLGEVDWEKLNVYGGSIAIGHPFGATGARLVITLLNELKRRNKQYGLVTVCAAGAMGAAMVLERE